MMAEWSKAAVLSAFRLAEQLTPLSQEA